MSVMMSTIVCLVAVIASVFGAALVLGTNPFENSRTFFLYAVMAVVVSVGVVGGFTLISGPPRITFL